MPIRSIPLGLFSMPKQAKKIVNTLGKLGPGPDSFPVQGTLTPHGDLKRLRFYS